MIDKIEVENLTVFEKLEINTNSPINVFIGENGTGKTQLLKFIYGTWEIWNNTWEELFNVPVAALIKNKNLERACVCIAFGDERILHEMTSESWDRKARTTLHSEDRFYQMDEHHKNFIFIPAKDMLTHSKGLPEMKEKYGRNMPFDKTLIDIITKARYWNVGKIPELAKNMIPRLEDVLDGKVVIESERFFIEKRNGDKIPFDTIAEGIKKIGLLWQLLMNESITEGSILLWDEPEININPKLTAIIVRILSELSQNGVQIFLSTHDYFLAKYLDIIENDCIFHSLYQTEQGVKCESNTTFSKLTHNDIMDERVHLYDAELEKEFSS